MEPSLGIATAKLLAAVEAAASQYKEIEPEHLLVAILSLSELDVTPDPASLSFRPFQDVQELKIALAAMKLDATKPRRKLRQDIRMGGTPPQGETIPLSRKAQRIFEVAEKIAQDEKAECLTVLHLFKALIQEPSHRIARIVIGKSVAGDEKDSTTLGLTLDPDIESIDGAPEIVDELLDDTTIWADSASMGAEIDRDAIRPAEADAHRLSGRSAM